MVVVSQQLIADRLYLTPQKMKYYAIIVGGGAGTRMKTEIPKQFLPIGGKPVLFYTIEAFAHSFFKPEIILVVHPEYDNYWKKLCKENNFAVPHLLVAGGNQRFDSVKNGLKAVKGKAIVAVHDAVRPMVSNELITNAYKQAEATGTAVAAVNCSDSVRQLHGEYSEAINRDGIFFTQTPQTFRSDILKQAYRQTYQPEFTDDASVVEKFGVKISLIAGEKRNLKITFPEDLLIAQLFLDQLKKNNPH